MHRRRRIFATAVAVMLVVVGIDALVYLHANRNGTSFISAAAPPSPNDGTHDVTATTHASTRSTKRARPSHPAPSSTIPPLESAAPRRNASSRCAIPVHLFAFVMQVTDPADTTTTEPPPPTTTTEPPPPPPPTTTTTRPPPPPPPTTTTHPAAPRSAPRPTVAGRSLPPGPGPMPAPVPAASPAC